MNAQATMLALEKLRFTGNEQPEDAPKAVVEAPSPDMTQIKVVSKGDISKEGTLKA